MGSTVLSAAYQINAFVQAYVIESNTYRQPRSILFQIVSGTSSNNAQLVKAGPVCTPWQPCLLLLANLMVPSALRLGSEAQSDAQEPYSQ